MKFKIGDLVKVNGFSTQTVYAKKTRNGSYEQFPPSKFENQIAEVVDFDADYVILWWPHLERYNGFHTHRLKFANDK